MEYIKLPLLPLPHNALRSNGGDKINVHKRNRIKQETKAAVKSVCKMLMQFEELKGGWRKANRRATFYFRQPPGMDPNNTDHALKCYDDALQAAGLIVNDVELTPLPPVIEFVGKCGKTGVILEVWQTE